MMHPVLFSRFIDRRTPIRPEPGYHAVEMWKRFCTPTEEGGDIDTIWVQVTNPGQSLPDLRRLAEPASKPDFPQVGMAAR